MNDLPAPLTPPECDLRGLSFMPLDVIRLLDSDIFALGTGEEFKGAMSLWCKAWLQKPSSSLPDDDKILAHLSGSGIRWKKIKYMALRGFIKCSDGRLYHPVVAEKALEAWDRRTGWNEKNNNEKSRQQRWRERQKQLSEELKANGITPPRGASLETLKRLRVDDDVDICVDSVDVTARRCSDVVMMPLDRDRDKEENRSVASTRAAKLPSDFKVPVEWLIWAAKEKGWHEHACRSESESFVDYWHAKAGKDAAKRDWFATWRNWVRNSKRISQNGKTPERRAGLGVVELSSPC